MAHFVYYKEKPKKRNHLVQRISYIMLVVGAFVMFWAYYPIVSFEIYSRFFLKQRASSPVPDEKVARSVQIAQTVYAGNTIFSHNLRDFTSANVWFPSSDQMNASGNLDVKEYTLSIPKLNLFDLQVAVGGDDLSKSLIHYLPRSLPGQYGNVALFGHSTIPQLFNPKDYKTVFTYLPKLELGDTVQVDLKGTIYTYEVFDTFVVKPDQVSVLDQNFSDSYLTLITCVPPGTWEKRLIVKARLKKK